MLFIHLSHPAVGLLIRGPMLHSIYTYTGNQPHAVSWWPLPCEAWRVELLAQKGIHNSLHVVPYVCPILIPTMFHNIPLQPSVTATARSSTKQATSQLPLTRVKNIIKSDPDITLASQEATLVISKVQLKEYTMQCTSYRTYIGCRLQSFLFAMCHDSLTYSLWEEREKRFKEGMSLHVYLNMMNLHF